MSRILRVVLAVLLSSSVSAKSTESALVSKTGDYSFHVNARESPVSLDDDVRRTLSQEPEDGCPDCFTLRQDIYNEILGAWLVDNSTLEKISSDIHCVVSCANPSERVMLFTNSTITLKRTITIDKPVTITGFHESFATREETELTAENKTAISCPKGSDRSIFNIQSGGVTIAGLQIRDCFLEEDESPIVIESCHDNGEGVRIQHVDFVSNTHSSQLVAVDASASSSCDRLEVTNVSFKDNQADDSVAVVRVGSASIMRDIRLENNTRTENGTRKALLLLTATGTQSDTLTIDGLVARGNHLIFLKSNSSVIKILNSNFTGNEVGTDDARMFQFPSGSKVEIRNCSFAKNTGEGRGMIMLESEQSIEIRDSVFAYNTESGSVIFGTGSELSVINSNFTSNNGTLNGGVIYLVNSNATLKRAFFTDNRSGGNGGSIFAINNSALAVHDSSFTSNIASAGGCFYIEKSDVSIARSTFLRNKADLDGGAIRLEQGGCVCNDSMFEDNSSKDEGGAIHIENARHFKLQSVSFTSRNAAFGSVLRIDKSRTDVILRDVHFRDGVVELTGAALYIDDSDVTIDGATFINNTGPYGGAIYLKTFDTTIRNSVFKKNSATVMGGAISGDNGRITIESTTFKDSHSYLGGALHFYNATFVASEIKLLNNHASEGGGILFKDSSVTIVPLKDLDPRIPKSKRIDSNTSFGIYARNNTGIDGGGVIDAIDSNIGITYGTFSGNKASEGGAIQATSSNTTSIVIAHAWFKVNAADVRGGALVVRSANEGKVSLELSFSRFSRCIADQGGAVFLASVNATVKECDFVNNAAAEGGATFFRKDPRLKENNKTKAESADINIKIEDCSFGKNKAVDRGGAVMLKGEAIVNKASMSGEDLFAAIEYAEEGFNVALKSVNLTKNQVYKDGGGGVHAVAVSLDIHSIIVKENKAPKGGGVLLDWTKVKIFDSHFIGNRAVSSGGGIMMTKESYGTISSSSLQRNEVAEDGGGLSLSGSTVTAENLIITHNKAASGGGVSLVPGSNRDSRDEKVEVDSGFLCFECTFSTNKASGSGGGLNVQSRDKGVLVLTQLEKCRFEHNSASVYGGGIHFVRPFNRSKCETLKFCGLLVILDTSLVDNKAGRSGGSILSNDRDRVIFSCADSEADTSSLEFINETRATDLKESHNSEGLCSQWIYGESCAEKFSPLVSSYVRNCTIKDVKDGNWNVTGNNSVRINETVPGERLPDILIECYDEYNNVVKSAVDADFKAILKSKKEGYLMGIFVTDLQDGVGKFTGVRNPPKRSFNSSYSYELEISFSLDFVKPLKVWITVRECRINEQKEDEGVQCKQCDATQYNFNPMTQSCKSCDDTLDCAGTYVSPKGNLWHSSPCHVPAQKCLTANACEETADHLNKLDNPEFINISAALNEFSCNFSSAFREQYHRLQCEKGYEGVLCGSCEIGCGRSLNFACTRCEHPTVSIFMLISVCVWLAAIAAFTIRGSMTIEEKLTIFRKQLHDIAALKGSPCLDSQSKATGEDGKKEEAKEKTRVKAFANAAHKRALKVASKLSAMFQWLRLNHQANDVTTSVETPEEINNLKLSQLAKWKLCEVVKVAINFLQAISVAAVINVEWTTYMLTMFDLSALAGGASTALVTRAIQCFPWWNGTKYATYAGLLSSILVPTFVVLCIVAFFAVLAYKTSTGVYYFVKRSALATIAICYFSYLSITKIAVMVFYCIGVRTDDDSSSEHETYYWALDTSIQCADQGHKGLMVLGGILFVLFSVGFPLISAFILVLCRKADGSKDPQWMKDILGFLYRAYKREFVYWESTVMLRKALLSVIAVFSYHLGGHSQGLLASCILSVCLFLQAIYKPYRAEFETVNNIESLSLLISGLTFTLAQFFMKDRTDESVKVALAVFLMTSIIVFFTYLLVCVWVCFIDVLRTDLRVKGALLDEDENSLTVVGSLVVNMLGLSSRPRDSDDDDDDELAAIESGSMRKKQNDYTLSDKLE